MRSTLSAGLAAFAMVAGFAAAAHSQAAPIKLAYVNVDALMPNVPGFAQAESLYNKDEAAWDNQMKAKQDSLTKMQDAYNKALPTMSDSVRVAKARPIQTFMDSARALQTALEAKAQARQTELMNPLRDVVQKVLDDFRTENGYAFIFRVSANEPSPFVAFDKNLDVTERIIQRLKALPATTFKRPPGE